MKISFLLAWRYLWGRKQRMILTTLAVVFGVALLFGLTTMIPAMSEAFRHNMMTTSGVVDISVSSVSNNPFDQSALQEIEHIEGIGFYSGRLSKTVILPESLGGNVNQLTGSSTVTLTGLDPATAGLVRNYAVKEGRFFDSADLQTAVIPQLLADKLELKIGDVLSIPSSDGIAKLTIIGILSISESVGLDEILVPLSEAQVILNLPEKINTIDILLRSNADQKTVTADLLSMLGSNYKIGPVEVGEELTSVMSTGQSMMWLMGILALAMASFIIFNSFRTVVAERRRDLGMLRAIGASRSTVLGLILAESFIQGIIGTALGLLLGYFLSTLLISGVGALTASIIRTSFSKPVITPLNLGGSILLGIGFTVGSGYLPARSATKVTPLEAMRPTVGVIEHHQNKRNAIIGIALMVLASIGLVLGDLKVAGITAVLFLFGLMLTAPSLVTFVASVFGKLVIWIYPQEGRLAQGNLKRQPSRAAITASSMMIGLAVCLAILAMITSVEHRFMSYIDKSLGTDYLLMPPSLVLGGGNVGANQGLLDSIRSVEGIEVATSLRLASSQADGFTLQLIGLEPSIYSQIAGLDFSKGKPDEAFEALDNGKSIIINGVFATDIGAEVGDKLTLVTPHGEQVYTVSGIAFDYLNAKISTGYISQKNLSVDFDSESDILILVNQLPKADTAKVSAGLKEVVKEYPAFSLIDSNEFKRQQMEMFESLMSVFYLMVFMMAIPGLIAMANTMSINVIERTREIGLLRAVGSTREQISRIIFSESLLLSSLGIVMGIVVGLFMSYLLVKAISFIGFTIDFYFPISGILTTIVVGLAFGVIAALVPARQASRTVIVEAIQFE